MPTRIKMILVGSPGSGKTRFAAGFPNPVFAECKAGLTSLSGRDIPFVRINSEDDLLSLKQALESPEKAEETFGRKVDTLIVDTVDELQRVLMAERLYGERRAETIAGDWGWIGQRMHTIFEGLTDLDLNVIAVVHPKDIFGDDSEHRSVKLGMGGAFADQMHQYFDFSLLLQSKAYFAEQETGERELVQHNFLRTYQGGAYEWVSDKTGKLPPEINVDFEFDYETLTKYINSTSSPKEEVAVVPETDQDSIMPGQMDIFEAIKADGVGVNCDACNVEIESQDRLDLAMIRYRKPLCATCFDKERKLESV